MEWPLNWAGPGSGPDSTMSKRWPEALSQLNVEFEENNPVTKLMVDRKKGFINPEVLGEKVLSAIVEFMTPVDKLPQILEVLDRVSKEINTVFSGDMITRIGPDGSIPYLRAIQGNESFYFHQWKEQRGTGEANGF